MARMTRPTTAPLRSGSGSLNGIAAQVSRPSMSTSRLTRRRTIVRTDARFSGTGHRLIDDAFEHLRIDGAIGRRRNGLARLRQFGVADSIKGGSGTAHLLQPRLEIAGRD